MHTLARPTVAVIGGGIAGRCTARALAERGADVVLWAPSGAPAASDVPVAVVQPVMGRRASASALRIAGFDAARRLLDTLGDAGQRAVRARGLLRIAVDEDRAADWARRADALPAGIARFLDANACAGRMPGLRGVRCGIWIPDALALHVPTLLARLGDGVPRIERRVAAVEPRAGGVVVRGECGTRMRFDRVVIAAGAAAPALLEPWLASPPFRSELHGEIAIMATPTPPPAMVGETGQVVPLGPLRVAVTASQREGGEPPAEAGLATLRERATRAWPALATAPIVGCWSGRRLTTRDAHPLVGPLDADARVWTVTGLGSRGLLFGALAAEQVAASMLADEDSLERSWSPTRGAKTTNPHSGG